jgi:hypothetical protein
MSKTQTNDFESENSEPLSKNVSVEQNEDFYDGFSPLDEPVKERAYTKGNIDTRGLEAELEEPSFDAPNFTDFDEESQEPSSFNPAMENLDKKEQLYATEQMVDTVLDVYGKAHLLANKVTKIKEDKIAKAMEVGEIDPSLEVPIDNLGNSLGLMDYVQEYNSQLSDAIKLEDDFIEKVKPPMIRVFQKKGLAMTDEQFLAVAFGTDILTKGAMIFQLVKQNNKLMSMWKEQSNFVPKTKPSKSSSSSTPPPPQPTQQTTQSTPPPPPPQPSETFYEPEESSAESMVKNMTGMKENSDFKNKKPTDGMPIFGDKKILSDMEKLASQEETIDVTPTKSSSNKRKRGRPKKTE